MSPPGFRVRVDVHVVLLRMSRNWRENCVDVRHAALDSPCGFSGASGTTTGPFTPTGAKWSEPQRREVVVVKSNLKTHGRALDLDLGLPVHRACSAELHSPRSGAPRSPLFTLVIRLAIARRLAVAVVEAVDSCSSPAWSSPSWSSPSLPSSD